MSQRAGGAKGAKGKGGQQHHGACDDNGDDQQDEQNEHERKSPFCPRADAKAKAPAA
jgi:hypothetical protein